MQPRPPERRVPQHISHSARESLERCARAYFLGRIAGAPKRPALWSIGGSAVHETTEHYDRMSLLGNADAFQAGPVWEGCFEAELDKARQREPNENKWGRAQTEPIEVWQANGLRFVQAYIDWRQRTSYEICSTPDGTPAIELDVSGHLPGCPVEIKAYVDRILHDPVLDQYVVLDLKTGKSPPKNADQFATYGALIEARYGLRCSVGVPFMNRKGTIGKPYDLSEVTPEAIGAVYGEAWKKIQAGSFPANGFPGNCYPCDVQAACAAAGGPLAAQFDPDHPDYPPPF